MDHAFQLSYEDILKILSSIFFGKGKSREECNKVLLKGLTVIGLPPRHQDYYKRKTACNLLYPNTGYYFRLEKGFVACSCLNLKAS